MKNGPCNGHYHINFGIIVSMNRRKEFSRRDFITALGIGGAVATLTLQNEQVVNNFSFQNREDIHNLSELKAYNKHLINPPSKQLIKPIVNAAFAPFDPSPDNTKRVVQNTRQLGSNTLRVYMNNDFERQTGEFNMAYIDRLKIFAEDVERESGGEMGIIVCLMDCYNLLYRNIENGLYKAKPLNHHALAGLDDPTEVVKRQHDFFQKQKYVTDYINRAHLIIDGLKPVNHVIKAWEVANEPDRQDMIAHLDEWYAKVVPHIRAKDPDTPIISGLKDPLSIDSAELVMLGLDHNSAHVYDQHTQETVHNYVMAIENGEDLPPLLLTEWGVHQKMAGIRVPKFIHDYRYAQALREVAVNNIMVNSETNEAYFAVYGLGLWQLDYSSSSHSEAESRDGFGIVPESYPQLTAAMQELSAVYSFN